MPNLKAKIDEHNKKIFENSPIKNIYIQLIEKRELPMRRTCLTENILYYARISCNDGTFNQYCIKEFAKLPLKKVTQMIKNLLMRKRTRTILYYLLNTGS